MFIAFRSREEKKHFFLSIKPNLSKVLAGMNYDVTENTFNEFIKFGHLCPLLQALEAVGQIGQFAINLPLSIIFTL